MASIDHNIDAAVIMKILITIKLHQIYYFYFYMFIKIQLWKRGLFIMPIWFFRKNTTTFEMIMSKHILYVKLIMCTTTRCQLVLWYGNKKKLSSKKGFNGFLWKDGFRKTLFRAEKSRLQQHSYAIRLSIGNVFNFNNTIFTSQFIITPSSNTTHHD